MMNCGVILPEPGYLGGLRDLLHRHGAFLAFDEVKTGATIAYGGAIEAFGVTPDVDLSRRRRSVAACPAARSARPRSCSGRSCATSTTWPGRSTGTR